MRWRTKRMSKSTTGESRKKLGDAVEAALSTVGITMERVEKWLGRPCRCRERRRKLNQLDDWVKKIITGEEDKSRQEFDTMVGDGETSSPKQENT